MPQRWFIRNASTDPLTGREPRLCEAQNTVGHVTEMTGHVPEIGGHDAETVGHDGPKYATCARQPACPPCRRPALAWAWRCRHGQPGVAPAANRCRWFADACLRCRPRPRHRSRNPHNPYDPYNADASRRPTSQTRRPRTRCTEYTPAAASNGLPIGSPHRLDRNSLESRKTRRRQSVNLPARAPRAIGDIPSAILATGPPEDICSAKAPTLAL